MIYSISWSLSISFSILDFSPRCFLPLFLLQTSLHIYERRFEGNNALAFVLRECLQECLLRGFASQPALFRSNRERNLSQIGRSSSSSRIWNGESFKKRSVRLLFNDRARFGYSRSRGARVGPRTRARVRRPRLKSTFARGLDIFKLVGDIRDNRCREEYHYKIFFQRGLPLRLMGCKIYDSFKIWITDQHRFSSSFIARDFYFISGIIQRTLLNESLKWINSFNSRETPHGWSQVNQREDKK